MALPSSLFQTQRHRDAEFFLFFTNTEVTKETEFRVFCVFRVQKNLCALAPLRLEL